MRKLFLIAVTFSLFITSLVAATGQSGTVWTKAVELYQQKQYDSAVVYFEQIAAQKPLNAEVYYNLGNTYYRLNKIAPAILNYERALVIEPDQKNAKENLALAQSRISNYIAPATEIFFVTWWRNTTHSNTATTWAAAALIAFTVSIILMAFRRFSKNIGARIPVQLVGGTLVLFCIFLVLGFSAARNSMQKNSAIVMINDAPLMKPELKGKPITLIPEGTKVSLRNQKGIWVEVSLPDGRSGWMQLNELEKI